jgi:hypothetical protein
MWEHTECAGNFIQKFQGERTLGRLTCRYRIILKWILKKYWVRVWTGFIWLTIGSSGGVIRTSLSSMMCGELIDQVGDY